MQTTPDGGNGGQASLELAPPFTACREHRRRADFPLLSTSPMKMPKCWLYRAYRRVVVLDTYYRLLVNGHAPMRLKRGHSKQPVRISAYD